MGESIAFSLVDPAERSTLEPFATVLVDEILPQAGRGRWFIADQAPSLTELQEITRRIEQLIESKIGHPLHPAIYIHALLVCVHFFYLAAQKLESTEDEERQTSALDTAYSLLQSLKMHHDLYDTYLRLS